MLPPPLIISILDRLEAVRPAGSGWVARCPAHEDRSPSLSVGIGAEGRVLVHCFAGCALVDVMAAIGMTRADLFPRDNHRQPARRPFTITRRVQIPTAPDPRFARLAEKWAAEMPPVALKRLAERLAVSEESLRRLGTGWDRERSCWTWPMRRADGEITGIRTRQPNDNKRSVGGSKAGLFFPMDLPLKPDVFFVCEGLSDTVAALDLGFPALGLPSAGGCIAQAVHKIIDIDPGEVAIWADSNLAGWKSAEAVAAAVQLYAPVKIVSCPIGFTDLRHMVCGGYTRDDVILHLAGTERLPPLEVRVTVNERRPA